MWDTVDSCSSTAMLSHDLPCAACGHAAHSFLACSDECPCVPPPVPGSAPARSAHPDAAEPARLTA